MNNRIFIIIIAILVLGALAFIILGGAGEEASSQLSSNTYGSSPHNIVLQEAYSLGCPSCAAAHPVLKQIREEYQDRIVFQPLHFPLTGSFPNAMTGHRAVQAAAMQGSDKFWAMHDKLFEEREAWVAPVKDPYSQIIVFAEELGLDIEQFETDFKSTAVNDVIRADERFLRDEHGISSTPSFVLNNEVVEFAIEDWRLEEASLELMREKTRHGFRGC